MFKKIIMGIVLMTLLLGCAKVIKIETDKDESEDQYEALGQAIEEEIPDVKEIVAKAPLKDEILGMWEANGYIPIQFRSENQLEPLDTTYIAITYDYIMFYDKEVGYYQTFKYVLKGTQSNTIELLEYDSPFNKNIELKERFNLNFSFDQEQLLIEIVPQDNTFRDLEKYVCSKVDMISLEPLVQSGKFKSVEADDWIFNEWYAIPTMDTVFDFPFYFKQAMTSFLIQPDRIDYTYRNYLDELSNTYSYELNIIMNESGYLCKNLSDDLDTQYYYIEKNNSDITTLYSKHDFPLFGVPLKKGEIVTNINEEQAYNLIGNMTGKSELDYKQWEFIETLAVDKWGVSPDEKAKNVKEFLEISEFGIWVYPNYSGMGMFYYCHYEEVDISQGRIVLEIFGEEFSDEVRTINKRISGILTLIYDSENDSLNIYSLDSKDITFKELFMNDEPLVKELRRITDFENW